jgi:hypothetical protein
VTAFSSALAVSTQTIPGHSSSAKSSIRRAFSIQGFQTTVVRKPAFSIRMRRCHAGSSMVHATAVQLKAGDADYYAVPGCTVVRADGYIVRQDWLDKVGLSLTGDNSVTLDPFTEIMKRFTLNDPDGNGQNDTYGFTAASTGGMLFLIFANPFEVNGDWWLKTDKGPYPYIPLMYSRAHDNMKKALEYN